jgi:RND superfamily putative drug exporter
MTSQDGPKRTGFGRALAALCHIVSLRPGWMIAAWATLALGVAVSAPSLTRLAAEGQSNLLPADAESVKMAEKIARAWPDQAYESLAVAALYRPEKIQERDRRFARRLAERFLASGHPKSLLRVLGPLSPPEVAHRLDSEDGTIELVVAQLDTSFVSPATHQTVAWMEAQARALEREWPAGLQVLWTGNAVIGRDYMSNVQTSLDRAATATVMLLLVVLLIVYRSILLALVPLVTIGVSLVVARGVLAWLAEAGWEVSPLVELFLIAVLFGSGTDFCLFLAWRLGEHWDPDDPTNAVESTLRGASRALLTSAGTVIVGLSLMGTTRFKLFSSTGPSVALGLALTLVATLTLTPALLVLLARLHPRSFAGLTRPDSGFWDKVGQFVLKRPLLTWLATLVLMVPPALVGLRNHPTQDTLTEMPPHTPSIEALRRVAAKFGEGTLAPLTVVVQAESPGDDLRSSLGLALIDDASRFLNQNRWLSEIRSATQPLGSTTPLDPARLDARLTEVNKGFAKMAEGAAQLRNGLLEGVGKLRAAMLFESMATEARTNPSSALEKVEKIPEVTASNPLLTMLNLTNSAMQGTRGHVDVLKDSAERPVPKPAQDGKPKGPDPRLKMLDDLTHAADGAGQIASGAVRAESEVARILNDPVGRHALDRLLITPENIREHPDLLQSFHAYISPDGELARIDLTPKTRMSSEAAMDQVVNLRRRLGEYLGESMWLKVRTGIAGTNAEAADLRALTRRDQYQTWLIVPLGVFVILMIALRDPWSCLNLVATMLLTYAFALGVTHLVFITLLGDEGLDWKVPYFLFVLLVAVGVDYNVFLMTRLQEETRLRGLRLGIARAIAHTGGLITSAAMITACSFASFLLSPLSSLRQLGFALVVGITIDAVLVRPVLVPCGHWLMTHPRERNRPGPLVSTPVETTLVHGPD